MYTENDSTDANLDSKGLGDTIAKLTEALGIDKIAESVAHAMGKEECGCKKRQQKLNEMFPYKGT